MATILEGNGIGRQGQLAVGCSAAIFDETHEHILLIRRADNGCWAVPGGYMEPGENLAEACEREVLEETGLVVTAGRLIGVYTDPNLLFTYADGNAWQLVIMHFMAEVQAGVMSPGEEAVNVGYFSVEEVMELEMFTLDRLRVVDAFVGSQKAIVHNTFAMEEINKNIKTAMDNSKFYDSLS